MRGNNSDSQISAFEAVAFDLYGTLVDFSVPAYLSCLAEVARILDAEPEAFSKEFQARFVEVELGSFGLRDLLSHASGLAASPALSIARLEAACRAWNESVFDSLRPRDEAVEVLQELRARGLRTALITNCAPPTAELWNATPFADLFDATVFSYEV